MAQEIITINSPSTVITITGGNEVVTIEDSPSVEIVTISAQGVQGVQGEKGEKGEKGDSGTVQSFQCGEAIGGQRVVVTQNGKLFHADSSNLNHAFCVVGISQTAGAVDDFINVYSGETIEDGSFSFTPNALLFLTPTA